jgi:hypothetical protein
MENKDENAYWEEFTNTTAREVLVKLVERCDGDTYGDFAEEAVSFARALTEKLRNK